MRVSRKYHLELHWDKVDYSRDDVATLEGAYFCGPVFEDAQRLLDEDELILDMTSQHEVFVPDFYQAVLHWKGVEYKATRVLLKEAWIRGKYVNSIETLENTDWILIDCKDHDTKRMEGRRGRRLAPGVYETIYNHTLVYWAEVYKQNKEIKF